MIDGRTVVTDRATEAGIAELGSFVSIISQSFMAGDCLRLCCWPVLRIVRRLGAGRYRVRGSEFRRHRPRQPASDLRRGKPALPAGGGDTRREGRDPAAPATRAVTDMQPTDALFDAINRGDIASARDALNRGADLNGVNVLGLTPMELSVDLGRNDISFLLLSMRGEDSGRGSRSVGRDGPAGSAPRPQSPRSGTRLKSQPPAPSQATTASRPATPKLFANDGGTPLPSAGFLGFDFARVDQLSGTVGDAVQARAANSRLTIPSPAFGLCRRKLTPTFAAARSRS